MRLYCLLFLSAVAHSAWPAKCGRENVQADRAIRWLFANQPTNLANEYWAERARAGAATANAEIHSGTADVLKSGWKTLNEE